MISLLLGLSSKLRSGDGTAQKIQATPAAAIPSVSAGDLDLQEYICASPLLGVCGITPADVAATLPRWKALGAQVAQDLKFPAFEKMEDFQKLRIYQYYLPVYFWCEKRLEEHRASGADGPLVIGISAPQGCGKSTVCEQLEALFTSTGRTAASISIDDFYLTRQDQLDVSAAHPGNPLLEMRGNAGSHDLELGAATLRALRFAGGAPAPAVPIPRYNKSAFQGQGDRADPATWPKVQGPVDVVLFEGWMLGFRPVGDAAAAAVDANLIPVNSALKAYEDAWDSAVNAWLVVKVADPQFAYRWRLQAEKAMAASGKPAMSDEQVAAFVDRFMPAYRCYLEGLYSKGPTTAAKGKVLTVEVDENRSPVKNQPAPVV